MTKKRGIEENRSKSSVERGGPRKENSLVDGSISTTGNRKQSRILRCRSGRVRRAVTNEKTRRLSSGSKHHPSHHTLFDVSCLAARIGICPHLICSPDPWGEHAVQWAGPGGPRVQDRRRRLRPRAEPGGGGPGPPPLASGVAAWLVSISSGIDRETDRKTGRETREICLCSNPKRCLGSVSLEAGVAVGGWGGCSDSAHLRSVRLRSASGI